MMFQVGDIVKAKADSAYPIKARCRVMKVSDKVMLIRVINGGPTRYIAAIEAFEKCTS